MRSRVRSMAAACRCSSGTFPWWTLGFCSPLPLCCVLGRRGLPHDGPAAGPLPFSSLESVSKGHAEHVCEEASDAVLERVASETVGRC